MDGSIPFGGLVQVKASAADTGGQYTLLEVTMPANAASPLHVHYTEDEGFYLLEGSVTIHVGDETVTLGPGQHAFGPRDIPHRFEVGPEDAHMLWVLTPGGFEALVEEASVPATAPTLPPADVPRRRARRRRPCRTQSPCRVGRLLEGVGDRRA